MNESNSPAPNPVLIDLRVLVGQWDMELSNAAFLPDRSATVKGEISVEWLEDEAFLIMRMGGGQSTSPGAIWLFSRDESSSDYKVSYYDDRHVSRIYEMSFFDNMWKIWREFPGFSQRYEGKISTDANTISGHWDKSTEGQEWGHDFDVTYTRVK